jgi:hypothetical protein
VKWQEKYKASGPLFMAEKRVLTLAIIGACPGITFCNETLTYRLANPDLEACALKVVVKEVLLASKLSLLLLKRGAKCQDEDIYSVQPFKRPFI